MREAFTAFEAAMCAIGDSIAGWRQDSASRDVLDPQQFKTRADRMAHDLIDHAIRSHFGDVELLSEESETRPGARPDRYWIIDPLDGTASWYNGFDGFVTQAALVEQGVPVYGLVYAPQWRRLWTAHRGQGACVNGQPLTAVERGTTWRVVDNYPEPRRIARDVMKALDNTAYVECGSMGLKACLVADDVADIFVKDVLFRDWDLAPAMVILQETGAVICDLRGDPIVCNDEHEKQQGLLVAANEAIRDRVLQALNRQEQDYGKTHRRHCGASG